MKINPSETILAEIKSLRKKLAAELATQSSADAELVRLNKREQALRDEISELEDGDAGMSEDSAVKLSAKRIQLEQTVKRIQPLSNQTYKQKMEVEARIRELLREFSTAAVAATGPSVKAYVKKVADSIRPYCLDDANAQALAMTLPAPRSLVATYTLRYDAFGHGSQSLQTAIDRADEILSGQLKWTWRSTPAVNASSAK